MKERTLPEEIAHLKLTVANQKVYIEDHSRQILELSELMLEINEDMKIRDTNHHQIVEKLVQSLFDQKDLTAKIIEVIQPQTKF